MTGRTRLTARKKLILKYLDDAEPREIATLNELRVRSWWEQGSDVSARSRADQKKSFTRTLVEHGEPFDVIDLSKTYEGMPTILTAGIFARWAVWDFIERGFLTDLPPTGALRLYMGHDACTGVLQCQNDSFAVIGTTCRLRKLYLVAKDFSDDKVGEISKVSWRLYGQLKKGRFQEIGGNHPLWKLEWLSPTVSLSNGRLLSMSKAKYQF